MKVEYLNPFLDASRSVIQELGLGRATVGKIEIAPNPHGSGGLLSMIGITGRLTGRVLYDMNESTAINIAGVMMGETLPELTQMARSAIGEFTNMISGNAATILKERGFAVDITPPTVITGGQMTLTDFGEMNVTLVVPLILNKGVVTVNLAIKEAHKHGG
ncbi:MAG: hypothetical protein A3G34_00525 [Candidatus Lindowbacteria bacterium RIFCSPLOWO2_12_FULL_62_27]|nr:MAG: hypothetical protein A3G34_00525 [Candidatus Lindowbacteria bacterium RIFCSPLOWO2_12_FULL_62_27]OGH58200.1 MAG: hypothetical protein A3I06_01030 [Candidatus Lindowbacteria bacterium RIFCSPLOWO2_02_FULL_62_12]